MSNNDITNYYVSGWCGTCGRKRGADGRCTNCDAWWTSPLIKIGAPAIVITFSLLCGAISLIKSKSAPAPLVMQQTPHLVASNTNSISPGSPYYPPSRAISYPSGTGAPAPFAPRMATAAFVPLPTAAAMREAQQLAEFNRLQEVSRAADAALRADDMAREARNRALNRSRPLYQPISTPAAAPRGFDTTVSPTLTNTAETAVEPES